MNALSKIALLATIVVGLFSAPAHAQMAAKYYFLSNNRTSMKWVNIDSEIRSGSTVRYWSVIAFKQDEVAPDGTRASFLISYEEFDCSERKSRTLKGTLRARDLALLFSSDEPGQWNFPEPGTVGGLSIDFACAPQNRDMSLSAMTDLTLLGNLARSTP